MNSNFSSLLPKIKIKLYQIFQNPKIYLNYNLFQVLFSKNVLRCLQYLSQLTIYLGPIFMFEAFNAYSAFITLLPLERSLVRVKLMLDCINYFNFDKCISLFND